MRLGQLGFRIDLDLAVCLGRDFQAEQAVELSLDPRRYGLVRHHAGLDHIGSDAAGDEEGPAGVHRLDAHLAVQVIDLQELEPGGKRLALLSRRLQLHRGACRRHPVQRERARELDGNRQGRTRERRRWCDIFSCGQTYGHVSPRGTICCDYRPARAVSNSDLRRRSLGRGLSRSTSHLRMPAATVGGQRCA